MKFATARGDCFSKVWQTIRPIVVSKTMVGPFGSGEGNSFSVALGVSGRSSTGRVACGGGVVEEGVAAGVLCAGGAEGGLCAHPAEQGRAIIRRAERNKVFIRNLTRIPLQGPSRD